MTVRVCKNLTLTQLCKLEYNGIMNSVFHALRVKLNYMAYRYLIKIKTVSRGAQGMVKEIIDNLFYYGGGYDYFQLPFWNDSLKC